MDFEICMLWQCNGIWNKWKLLIWCGFSSERLKRQCALPSFWEDKSTRAHSSDDERKACQDENFIFLTWSRQFDAIEMYEKVYSVSAFERNAGTPSLSHRKHGIIKHLYFQHKHSIKISQFEKLWAVGKSSYKHCIDRYRVGKGMKKAHFG